MGKQSIENQILDTIEIVADKMVKQAGYDKTISAVISRLEDPTSGKYLVKYQDSSFYAYSTNTNISYTSGTNVYVQVHNGDMSSNKTIIGAVKNLGTDFGKNLDTEDHYEEIGINCIIGDNVFSLSSYKTETVNIYTKNGSNNKIEIKDNDLKQYLKKANTLLCEVSFKTNLPIEQQYNGSYGVIYTLNFNTPAGITTRTYSVDINSIEGMPYRLPIYTPTQAHFDINGVNFDSVQSIDLFVRDFPVQDKGKEPDIFIKDIKIIAEKKIDANLLKGYYLTVEAPLGTIFTSNPLPSKITLKPKIKFNGQVVDNATQDVKFYWFKENMEVTSGSKKYHYLGGEGWQYLPEFVEVCKIFKKQVYTNKIKYKCIAYYADLKLELKSEIEITNNDSDFIIDIKSINGTEFTSNYGFTDIKCLVSRKDKVELQYDYVWGYNDYQGAYHALPYTNDINNTYHTLKDEYDYLNEAIKAGDLYPEANKKRLQELYNNLSNFGGFGKEPTLMRVEDNGVYGINVSKITSFNIYKCSVFTTIDNNRIYLGTVDLSIYNKITELPKMTIVLNNKTQVFKYNENGVAPTVDEVERKQNLVGLSVDLYDEHGEKIPDSVLDRLTYRWEVAAADTMLKIPSQYDSYKSINPVTNIATYTGNLRSFSYDILEKYNISFDHNDIRVFVEYNGQQLTDATNFLFIKEGALGTNGTKYVCKIVPRTLNKKPWVPILSNKSKFGSLKPDTYELNYRIINSTDSDDLSQPWFTMQLWEDGNLIFDDYQSGVSTSGDDVIITWSLQGSNANYESNLRLLSTLSPLFMWKPENLRQPCNLIKCSISYKGHYYYCNIPIVSINTTIGYKIDFIDYGGFLTVEYSSQGDNPKYDNNEPFNLRIKKEINNIWEDVTENSNFNFVYEWEVLGGIYNPLEKTWSIVQNLIPEVTDKLPNNQKGFKPIPRFNGECLNNAIKCTIKNNGNVIGTIHIPIVMYLNRYANTAINGWDGNSVSIDKLGNGSIFAPQIGAGRKEEDNSFSGLLMGEVKEGGQDNSKLGLIGYYKGQQDLYISAYNGYAIFGKQGPGQIILDPSSNQAMLYSSNFWKEYNNSSTPEKDGLPKTTYVFDEKTNKYNNQSNKGMLIDLTNSRIIYGNGKFSVDENGNLIAQGTGKIAGWEINGYQFFRAIPTSASDPTGLSVGMNSVSIGDEGAKQYEIQYPNSGRIAKIKKNLAFWSGTYNKPNFCVTHDGYMMIQQAAIGSGTDAIFIGNYQEDSAIFSSTKTHIASNSKGFYLGNSGIGLGGSHNIFSNIKTVSEFQVDADGTLYARKGYIGSGTSGWTISDKSLDNGGRTDYNDITHKGVYLGTDGISLGLKSTTAIVNGEEKSVDIIPFYVDRDGSLYSVKGQIANWTINENSLSMKNGDFEISIGRAGILFGDVFSVNSSGEMFAVAGKIAGWNITPSKLTSGNISIDSGGSISCGEQWSIENSGKARFRDIEVTGGTIKINGTTISGSSSEGTGSGNSFSGDSFSTSGGASFSDGGIKLKEAEHPIFNLQGQFFTPITVMPNGQNGNIVLNRDGVGTADSWKADSLKGASLSIGPSKGSSSTYLDVGSSGFNCGVTATFGSASFSGNTSFTSSVTFSYRPTIGGVNVATVDDIPKLTSLNERVSNLETRVGNLEKDHK